MNDLQSLVTLRFVSTVNIGVTGSEVFKFIRSWEQTEWCGRVGQESKTGSKRKFVEMEAEMQHFEDYCTSTISRSHQG
jgi:hypothetical protein